MAEQLCIPQRGGLDASAARMERGIIAEGCSIDMIGSAENTPT